MTFRSRVLLAAVPLGFAPLVLFALGVRRQVDRTLTAQYEERVDMLASVVREDLSREAQRVRMRLRALAREISEDNRLRAAVVGDADRAYLLDYAGRAAELSGLDVLQVHDEGGRILSSANFRNDYDRLDAATPSALTRVATGAALMLAPSPRGVFPALVVAEGAPVAGRVLTLVGGERADESWLARLSPGDVDVRLEYPGGVVARGDAPLERGADVVVESIELPFVRGGTAALHVAQPLSPLLELRGSTDRWFLGAVLLAAVLAILLGVIVAAGVSRPLSELARRTSRIDLDRLDTSFASDRDDEVGVLSRMLDVMVRRLRAGAARLRDAERRATLGEVARQVNHDVRNGLIPIRNVVDHLSQLADARPEEMRDVFLERRGTLESSIGYLQSLAANYARISPRLERRPCDVNDAVREVVRHAAGAERIRTELGRGVPPVHADAVALRRILENLVSNAVESLDSARGDVRVTTAADVTNGRRSVRIDVADSGAGMTEEQLERVFDDFYTTKERGTGLGLSIVRRLVADLGGTLAVHSEAGRGSCFTVTFPEADVAHDGAAPSAVAAHEGEHA